MKKICLLAIMFLHLGTLDAQYCEASASNSNYEWIEGLRVFTKSNSQVAVLAIKTSLHLNPLI